MTPTLLELEKVGSQRLHIRSGDGPIIVASDGGAPAATALAVAKLLRERTGSEIRVVSVVEPTAAVVPAPMLVNVPVPESRVELRHAIVREQIDRIVGDAPEVPLEIEVGWTPAVLTQVVRESGASIFVAGLVHHGRVERIARTETPLSVLRGASVPVLALPWGMMREPRCVVIGVDLTETSLVAARRAAPLLHAAERVYLVHVQEPVAPLAELPVVPEYDDTAARDALENVAKVLELPPAAEVETRILVGHPAFELADLADYVRADLLVLGHRERNMWGRLLHSSVAERAYRLASCGVLIVPDRVASRERTPAREVITYSVADRRQWPGLMADFTRRNAGRRASVEVFSDAMGAQSASVNFPLFGVDCDPEARSVEIMLGDPERRSRHVTHTIHGVMGIELSSVVDGVDFALKLVHDEGETVLAFVV